MSRSTKRYSVKSEDEFYGAMKEAMPGDQIIYHTGQSLDTTLGHYAYFLYEKGMACLIQRRIPFGKHGMFEYIAVRTKKHQTTSLRPLRNYRRPQGI